MAVLSLGAFLLTRRPALCVPSATQAALELLVDAVEARSRETMRVAPGPYRAFIGTLFVFIFTANWSSLVPGVEPPTAHLETDAALALLVFLRCICSASAPAGVRGYLASFAAPNPVMIPLNFIESLTRTFSLLVRLFGNVMSGVFVIGIVLSLAGLLVPIPLMALDLLTGAVQAYIFARAGDGVHRPGGRRNQKRKPLNLRTKGLAAMNWLAIASIVSAAMAVSFGAIGPALARRPRRRRRDGRHRAPAGSRQHDFADSVRRPRHDRDDGDLLPGHRAAAAVRQSAR